MRSLPAHHVRRLHVENEGQSLVEFALTISALLLFAFVMIEACITFYTYCMISESAREGTRYAIVHGATCTTNVSSGTSTSCTASAANISTYVANLGWPNLGSGSLNVTTTFPDGNQAIGSRVVVQVKYTLPVIVPLIAQRSVSMQSTSTMYIVQ